MNAVRIVTDSAAEWSEEEALRLSVRVLPLRYSVGSKIYRENVDISSDRLLELIGQGNTSVTVLPPATEDIVALIEEIARAGDVALIVHVAKGLVPLSQPIQTVAQDFLGRARIEVIDSLAVSLGLQCIVREAARAAAGGASLAEITQLVRGMISRVYTVFYTEDFEYLEKSADIQPAQAILAGILRVRPLVALEEGRPLPLEKVTPRSTPVDKLAEFVSEFASVDEVAVLVGKEEPELDLQALRDRISQEFPHLDVGIRQYGPLVASSVGPRATGVFVREGQGLAW